MRKFSKKQYLAAGAAAVIVASGAGVAFAYWTSTGTGSGTATTDSATNWNVVVDSTNLHDLSPAGPIETVHFHVTNPSSGVQNLQNTIASVVSTSHAGCGAGDFTVGTTSITYGDVASHTTVDGTFTLQMRNLASNQDACQGATVNLQVDAS
jgi:hypothetical protein